MDALELLDLIQMGESSTVQFKVRINDAYKVGTEMVAFSNTKGGLIIIGVDDETGEISGLSYEELQSTNEILANAASDNVKPQIFIETETVKVDDNKIIVAQIREGVSKPYTDNKGIIWLKNGSDKRKVVAREEMARLLQSSGNLFADETIVSGTTINDIDDKVFGNFLKKKLEKSTEDLGFSFSKLLSNMGLMKSGSLTLGGLLLFGKNPQSFRPTFTVQCVAVKGISIGANTYENSKEPFVGNLQELYEKTLAFIIQNLKELQTDEGFNSKGALEIPIESIQELLVNALVHRDYFINSSIKVFVFDDRIEIISPGKLPNSLTIENIKLGTSIIRNPILYSNINALLPFRGVGSGILRAYENYKDIDLSNDTHRELFIATIQRPVQNANA